MTPREARKLLGGWLAGNLTEEEKKALLEAALEDQALFEELVQAQPFKEVLADPEARAALLASLEEPPAKVGWLDWLRRPWPLAAAGAAAVAVLTVGFFATRPEPRMDVRVPAARAPMPEVPSPPAEPAARPPQEGVRLSLGVPVERAPKDAAEAFRAAEAPAAAKAQPPAAVEAAPPELSVRKMLAAAPGRAETVAVAPKLRTALLKLDSQGVYRELAQGEGYAAGDSALVQVTAPSSGVLRAWGRAADGRLAALGGELKVEGGKPYSVPPDAPLKIDAPERYRAVVVEWRGAAGESTRVEVTLPVAP